MWGRMDRFRGKSTSLDTLINDIEEGRIVPPDNVVNGVDTVKRYNPTTSTAASVAYIKHVDPSAQLMFGLVNDTGMQEHTWVRKGNKDIEVSDASKIKAPRYGYAMSQSTHSKMDPTNRKWVWGMEREIPLHLFTTTHMEEDYTHDDEEGPPEKEEEEHATSSSEDEDATRAPVRVRVHAFPI